MYDLPGIPIDRADKLLFEEMLMRADENLKRSGLSIETGSTVAKSLPAGPAKEEVEKVARADNDDDLPF